MVGPTGVGKTEIARRLAKLVDAPLVKVEATKFTEVGYVGRDVDSMVRDLVEAVDPPGQGAHSAEACAGSAEDNVEDRLVELHDATREEKADQPHRDAAGPGRKEPD